MKIDLRRMKSSGSGDSLVYGGNTRPGKGGGRKAVALIIMILVIAFVIIAQPGRIYHRLSLVQGNELHRGFLEKADHRA